MPQRVIADCDSDIAGTAQFRHGLDVKVPTIKILLYTDDPDDVTPEDSRKDFGLVKMLEHLKAREPAFANFCIKWVSRNSSNQTHADQKLDDVLERERKTGHPFEEIWFFGLHQANKKKVSFGVFRGGPESELTENEVSALRLWMEARGGDKTVGGGILMAGDHNHPRPKDTTPSTNPSCPGSAAEAFLGRGRAIGRCVPRAGLLRKWEGEPTNRSQDSHNTIVNSGLQTDKFPQELILINVDANGNPYPSGQPHPIFSFKADRWIKFFPDHSHEGEVFEPKNFDDELWPKQIRPHVVARGTDRLHAQLVDLVVTYNGDLADVGRIVADSSWHHYFNINVRPFSHPAPEGSPADQIGQFYANLAIWLAPRRSRINMALAMLWRLANSTALMEPLGDVWNIGREASSILLQVGSTCEIHEMIQAMVPARYGMLSFATEGAILSHLPPQELLLGCVLDSYHNEMIREETSEESYVPLGVNKVIELGFNRALKEHASRLEVMASETRKLIHDQ
jgi:hypothetical protein